MSHLRPQPVLTDLMWINSSGEAHISDGTCPSGKLRSLSIFLLCLKVTKERERKTMASLCVFMSMGSGGVLRYRMCELK